MYILAGDAHHSLVWELELGIACGLIIKDECIVKRYWKIVNRKLNASGVLIHPCVSFFARFQTQRR